MSDALSILKRIRNAGRKPPTTSMTTKRYCAECSKWKHKGDFKRKPEGGLTKLCKLCLGVRHVIRNK